MIRFKEGARIVRSTSISTVVSDTGDYLHVRHPGQDTVVKILRSTSPIVEIPPGAATFEAVRGAILSLCDDQKLRQVPGAYLARRIKAVLISDDPAAEAARILGNP